MSRNFDPKKVYTIKSLISEERLGTFRSITASDEDAIELHQAAMLLSAALMSITGIIEISVRNAICEQISLAYGESEFLRNTPRGLHWHSLEQKRIKEAERQAKRASYSKLENDAKEALDRIAFPNGRPTNLKHSEIARKRQATIHVSHGQVVSQLTIYFWKRLFSEQYEPTLWKRALKKIFPNKTYQRSQISEKFEVLYQIRNRLAHHELVYGSRLSDILDVIEFISHNIYSRKPDTESTFATFILPHRNILNSQVSEFQETFDRLKK